MRPRRSVVALSALATLAAFAALPMPPAQADTTTDTYIVELKPGVSADVVIPKIMGTDAEVLDKVGVGVADITSAQAAALAGSPYVKSVSKDAVMTASDTQLQAPWDLDKLDSTTAASDGNYVYPNTGSGVTVYVEDSGIVRTHPEFASVTVQAGVNFVPNGVTVLNGDGSLNHQCGPVGDTTVNPANTTDQAGHGTAVASLIAGATYGVAKGASIVPVRVLDCQGAGTSSDIIAGINWILQNHQAGAPAVANFSLGGTGAGLGPVDTAVQKLIAAGITVVAAAGNDGGDACNTAPAQVPGAITVAATTKTNAATSYTNLGACVDLFAPGDYVTLANFAGGHTEGRGTSYSAPLVAGAAALVLHDHPTWTPAQVSDGLVAQADTGVVTGLTDGDGSPNKFLHVSGIFTGTDPTITGPAYVGETLHAALHWAPAPATLTYQWNQNGVPITNATTATYVVAADDLGTSLTVTVDGSSVGYYDVSGTSAAVVPAVPPAPGMVVTMTPSRLMDTRLGLGATGPLHSGQTVILPVAGVGAIMSTVSAVLVNITVTETASPGYVTAYASGGAMPATSNVNFVGGATLANLALVPVGADGAIALTVSATSSVQLIVDVQSWVNGGEVTEAGAVVPVTPTRLWDTRLNGVVGSNQDLSVQVTDAGGVPTDAAAVLLNVTVTDPEASGYLTVYPSAEALPATSNLNFLPTQTVPNMVLVKVGADGFISIRNASSAPAHIVVDLQGYITAGSATAKGAVVPVSPVRVADTRLNLGAKGPVAGRSGVVLSIVGDSVPANVSGVFMNLTVTEAKAPGWVSAFPTQSAPPLVSNLNFLGGQTVPNLASVGLANAQATLYNGSASSVQLVADVFAYIL